MRHYLLMPLLLTFSICSLSNSDKEKDPPGFKYSSLGFHVIQTDETSFGGRLSLPLPGGLYFVVERKAEGIDIESDSYDRVINAARVGIHSGIGDIFSSISASGIKLSVKNIFDVYAELGLKSTAYETDINSFSKDDTKANAIAGIRFGNSQGWEGKLFVDFSKDADLSIKECPVGQVCSQAIEYELNDETDQKYGLGFTYNLNKRNSVIIEMSSSKIFDSSLKLGYQFNF